MPSHPQHPGPEDTPKGRPLRLDPDAVSASPDLPAFIARPPGAPVYHGFPLLEDVEVDGFRFGMITDFESQPDTFGDAFVVAPDDSRCGLVWEVSEQQYFEEVRGLEPGRWGVWAVGFTRPMTNRENVRANLRDILPMLKQKYNAWKSARGG